MAVGGALRRTDKHLGREIKHTSFPAGAAEFLADLGTITVAVPVLAAVAGYVARRAHRAGSPRWWRPPLAAVVTMAAVPVLVVPLKLLVDHPGPPGTGPSGGFYPSGHTATATVAYGAAALLLLPYAGSAYARRELVIGCVALNAAVGFGLVRRGYHWPLDVLGSWCLCGAMLVLLSGFLDGRSSAGPSRTPTR